MPLSLTPYKVRITAVSTDTQGGFLITCSVLNSTGAVVVATGKQMFLSPTFTMSELTDKLDTIRGDQLVVDAGTDRLAVLNKFVADGVQF